MKKVLSIVLLVLFLYNMLGYYVLFYFKNRSLEQEISLAIDSGQISDEDLILIKVPVPVYHQNDKDFERVEGNFEHQGRFYQLVKRKIANDTIYTYCLTDEKKAQLHAKLADHIQTHVADVKGHKPVKSEKQTPHFIKEYLREGDLFIFTSPAITTTFAFTPSFLLVPAADLGSTTPPPEVA